MTLLPGNPTITAVIDKIHTALPAETKAYLVGGAVRDLIAGRNIHDLDFLLVSSRRVIPIARKIADGLCADFYPLDKDRDTARMIIHLEDGARMNLDFASLRDEDLQKDLLGRDFSINAIAIDLDQREALIDPLQGAKDIYQKVIRTCSPESFLSDPVRILRAVRLAVQLDYKISLETIQLLRQALPHLPETTPERQRDEIFRLLSNPHVDVSLRVLEKLGILPYIFPEILDMIGMQQSSPHTLDVWKHTLSVIQKLEQLLFVLDLGSNLDETGNIISGWISLRLGRYRQQIADHFSNQLNPLRPARSLLFFAALYHDVGKAATQSYGPSGEIHFYAHENISRKILRRRANLLKLSSQEIDRLGAIAGSHLRPLLLNQSAETPSRRAIYKFWRDLGEAGVDVCLLSIADLMGTYGSSLTDETLTSHLKTVRCLLDAWWQQRQELVSPPALLKGSDLIQELNLQPGPVIGQILEAIRQAQVEESISNSQEAMDFARAWLENPQLDL